LAASLTLPDGRKLLTIKATIGFGRDPNNIKNPLLMVSVSNVLQLDMNGTGDTCPSGTDTPPAAPAAAATSYLPPQKPDLERRWDAFQALPVARQLDSAATAQNELRFSLKTEHDQLAVFQQPAFFPVPEFRIDGSRIERDGALIHEGMFLTASSDGTYEVRFVVETPRMPVTLRLQLPIFQRASAGTTTFSQSEANLTLPPGKSITDCNFVGTITLPPIHLSPDPLRSDRSQPVVYLVSQQGYSNILQRILSAPDKSSTCEGWRLVRRGTARFGQSASEMLSSAQ
jgi:hypothetical protein